MAKNLEEQFGGVQKWLMIGGLILLIVWGAAKMLEL